MNEEDLTRRFRELDDRITKLEDMANTIEQASSFYLRQTWLAHGDEPSYEDMKELLQVFMCSLHTSWDASDD